MTTATKQSQIGWSLWFQWVIASVAGLVVGRVIREIASAAIYTEVPKIEISLLDPGYVLVGIVGLGILWAIVGLAQLIVLRTRLSEPAWWVLASGSGAIIGGTIAYVASRFDANFLGGIAIFGAIGTAQWLVLRKQFSRAGWWVLASVVGLLLFEFSSVLLLVANAFYGLVTGGVLLWLLKQTAPTDSDGFEIAE